jgi:hypothetical protein
VTFADHRILQRKTSLQSLLPGLRLLVGGEVAKPAKAKTQPRLIRLIALVLCCPSGRLIRIRLADSRSPRHRRLWADSAVRHGLVSRHADRDAAAAKRANSPLRRSSARPAGPQPITPQRNAWVGLNRYFKRRKSDTAPVTEVGKHLDRRYRPGCNGDWQHGSYHSDQDAPPLCCTAHRDSPLHQVYRQSRCV